MGKRINELDLTGRPQPVIHRPPQRREPNCPLESDPFFGSFLIIILSFGVGAVTGGWGFIPFLAWALWMGCKPYR